MQYSFSAAAAETDAKWFERQKNEILWFSSRKWQFPLNAGCHVFIILLFFFYQVFFLPLLLRKCVWERDSLCVCTHACVCACVCMTERDRSSISSVPFRLLTVHRLPEVEKRWCGGGGADIFTAVCTRNKPKASIGWRQARGMQDTSSMCKNNPAGWEDGLPDASY